MTPRILKKSLLFIIAIILVLGLSISFQSLLAAWTAPAANPPTCATGDAARGDVCGYENSIFP